MTTQLKVSLNQCCHKDKAANANAEFIILDALCVANMISTTHYMAKILNMRLKRALVEFAPEVL